MCKVKYSATILNLSSRLKVYINANKEMDDRITSELRLSSEYESFLRQEQFRDQVGQFPVLLGLIQIFVQYTSSGEDITQLIEWSKEPKIENTARPLMPTLLKSLIDHHALIQSLEHTSLNSKIRNIFECLVQTHCPEYLSRLPSETVDVIQGHVSLVHPSASMFDDSNVCLDLLGACIKPSL
ncbi:MAG: hypothetical protein CMF42_01670 [Legionellales bacterium]|nr:hypothetical protein [Legionellales bacterium]|tara:strand:+ start:2914 stop:3462 length:549 start_codon:yes stop_codon:yes gene_type:complete